MTLLTIVQCATDVIGLPQPASVIGNSDQTVRTLLALVNREGQNLAKLRNTWGGGWVVLERPHTFTTVASQEEYALPTDFTELISETAWDRSNYWKMRGPLSPQEWQVVKSGLVASPALRKRFRIRRSLSSTARTFFVDPTPASADDLVFEYLSKFWVYNAAGTDGFVKFQADDDVSLLDEDLLEMGLIWRFLAAKKLGFAAELAEYELERNRRIGNDPGAQNISLARPRFRLPPGNVPETGFG